MSSGLLLLCGSLLVLAAGLGLAALFRLRQLTARLAAAEARATRGGRALDLMAREVHGLGLGLLGRAQVLGGEAGAGFEAEARRILALADAVVEAHGVVNAARALRDERFALGPVLADSVEAARRQLGPGLRHWRLDPVLESLVVRADARALRGALVQVLCRAARATGEGDFIDIRAVQTPQGVTIVVEDEGLGLAVDDLSPVPNGSEEPRTRGLVLGLSLARALLRAHGGELVMEAAPGVGARAFLSLPANRVVTG
ncbi:MAG TPA: sensor histidine kinase [Roseococcus sp.]|jgi:signal transduction histidine kinase|nr:sensor histidine kinase [Roseococcus sp.]